MELSERVRDLIEPYVLDNDAFLTSLGSTLLSYNWNEQCLYNPVDLAVADLLAITEYKGNHRRVYNYLNDKAAILDMPILAPSDSTLLRRLHKEFAEFKSLAKPLKYNVKRTRDFWAEVYNAQTSLLLEVNDASPDYFIAVMDGSPTPLNQANKARRVGEPTEVQQHRSAVVRNHGGIKGVPFYRSTLYGLPWHNTSIHGLEHRLSSMVYTEFEQQGSFLAHIERGSRALRRLDVPVWAVMVDRLYTQSGQAVDLLIEDFTPLGSWVMGPFKSFDWVTDIIQRGWTKRNAQELQVNGELKWWYCERAGWRSRDAKGRHPFWIFVVYQVVPDINPDELEENARIVQRRPGATIVGFACLVNQEVTAAAAPRLAGNGRRRWAGETFYKVPKHSLAGQSPSHYLFPRAHRTGSTWGVANSYGLWRGVRQNKYCLPNGDEQLSIERFRNHVRVGAERYLELAGRNNEQMLGNQGR